MKTAKNVITVGRMINMRIKKFFHIAAMAAGILLIVVGGVFLLGFKDVAFYGNILRVGQSTFGADFYTEIYKSTTFAANALKEIYEMISTCFGVLFIFIGVIDVCFWGSKMPKKEAGITEKEDEKITTSKGEKEYDN